MLRLVYQAMATRRCSLVILVLLMIWTLALIMLMTSLVEQRSSGNLKDEIMQLSVRYVKALAHENKETVDGPYAGRFTGYDLKKTLAVLLENVLERLDNVEEQLNARANQTVREFVRSSGRQANLTNSSQLVLRAKDLIQGKTEQCVLTEKQLERFPHCLGKLKWMQAFWRSDSCYADYGVDGSDCSIIIYLSEIEHWCPVMSWRQAMLKNSTDANRKYANVRYDIKGLMELLNDPGRKKYEWMKLRIQRMWPGWVTAMENLVRKQDMTNNIKKKILIHLGLLTKAMPLRFAESAFKGGPLGELVQWSDVITCLYMLGHDLTITHEIDQLTPYFDRMKNARSSCIVPKQDFLVVTDILGLIQVQNDLGVFHFKYSCVFRVVDSFGTEPGFNFDQYAKKHKLNSGWGRHNLWPKQFYNMFPHTPDNTFLGFVVEHPKNLTQIKEIKKKNQALVYGKNEYMWEGKQKYLDIIHKYVEIHGTVALGGKPSKVVPSYVKNHDILSGKDLMKLLRESKLFIGLGFPYEGPAALEAIANGAIYLNPKFDPPISGKNNAFFKGKPTLRGLTSQHPYAEHFIGEPYTFTVNITDPASIESTVIKALKKSDEVKPYLPFEYTEEGNLQRINSLLQHQDFCDPAAPRWPPPSAISYYLAEVGKSCKHFCQSKDLICEPTYLRDVNNLKEFQARGLKCESTRESDDLQYPAINVKSKACTFQSKELLFSCVGEHPELMRVCACRDYIKGQTALCKDCL